MVMHKVRTFADRWQHGAGEYAFLFEPYQGNECIVLDCETTSLDPQSAELVSIAAVKVRGKRILTSDRLDIKLQAPESLSADSIKIHKIRAMDLHGGEALGDALDELLHFIGNRPIVGYYIKFDMAVLNHHIRPRYGFSLPNRTIEVQHLYQDRVLRANPEAQPDLSFETIADKLSVPVMERHTALGDAVTTGLIYVRLKEGDVPTH